MKKANLKSDILYDSIIETENRLGLVIARVKDEGWEKGRCG